MEDRTTPSNSWPRRAQSERHQPCTELRLNHLDSHPTLYRFITRHAFTGEYTQRFYPLHTTGASSLPMQQASTNDRACTSTLPHAESTSLPTASPKYSHNFSPSRSISERCSASWRRRVPALNRGRGSRDRYCKTEAWSPDR